MKIFSKKLILSRWLVFYTNFLNQRLFKCLFFFVAFQVFFLINETYLLHFFLWMTVVISSMLSSNESSRCWFLEEEEGKWTANSFMKFSFFEIHQFCVNELRVHDGKKRHVQK